MREQWTAFWRRYGFYVCVAGCVAVLGVIAWAARGHFSQSASPAPTAHSAEDARQAGSAPEFVDSLKDVTSSPAPDASMRPAPKFSWPVERWDEREQIAYSPEEPIWFESLGQWAAHMGVDVMGLPGEVVTAAADGVVSASYADPMLGHIVEIEHEHGYRTRYASLSTHNLVRPGERVARGSVIGGMGESATCEGAMGPHLHFEVLLDGAPIDPAGII